MLINNFDLKVSAVKLDAPLVFGSRVQSVKLPNADDEEALGRLASIVAWTPDGVSLTHNLTFPNHVFGAFAYSFITFASDL